MRRRRLPPSPLARPARDTCSIARDRATRVRVVLRCPTPWLLTPLCDPTFPAYCQLDEFKVIMRAGPDSKNGNAATTEAAKADKPFYKKCLP